MTRSLRTAVLLVAWGTPLAGQQGQTLEERFDMDRRAARFDLPGRLNEVSGLAFTEDGRLFAHDDERGWVHEIDPVGGAVGKRFMLGEKTAKDDFEGIAIVGDRFFLISSGGLLYETREGADREEVAYRITDTGLRASCEVEGLEYLPSSQELLIPCKQNHPERGAIIIHRLPMDPEAPRPPPIQVALVDLIRVGLSPEFHPSGITYDPATGTLILVAAREAALLEITTTGTPVSGLKLSKRRHAQAEGIEIGPGGFLYLSDEHRGNPARITRYAPAGGM